MILFSKVLQTIIEYFYTSPIFSWGEMVSDCINYSVAKGSPEKPQYLDGKPQWTDAKEGKKKQTDYKEKS